MIITLLVVLPLPVMGAWLVRGNFYLLFDELRIPFMHKPFN